MHILGLNLPVVPVCKFRLSLKICKVHCVFFNIIEIFYHEAF